MTDINPIQLALFVCGTTQNNNCTVCFHLQVIEYTSSNIKSTLYILCLTVSDIYIKNIIKYNLKV